MSLEVIKLSKVKYSREQLQAIETKDSNLLVSASAGSGKTTVLIERILHMIKTQNINIDELLVVTFTEQAASELKLRLRLKLTEALLKDSTNSHIRKQLTKIAVSHISTFHAFCNQVLRKFFYVIDFDAIYNIADDVEINLILSEILENLFLDLFEANDPKFMLVVNRFINKTSDDYLRNLIFELFNKLRSIPDYESFKQKTLENYVVGENLFSWKYADTLETITSEKVNEAKRVFTNAYNLAQQFNHQYQTQYSEDREICNQILALSTYEERYQYLKTVKFTTFKSKSAAIDEISKNTIKAFRDQGKAIIIKELKEGFYQYHEKSQIKFIKENRKVIEALFYLVELFRERFTEAKREKNLVDFNDLEELTLKILRFNNGQNEAVKYYRELFSEILVDEFQDTNSMQEAIISLIARDNNLFMVGDVKQSIYRFRQAEPEIFQKRYKLYQQEINGKLISLNANFRSRKEILDFINFVFYQLMDELDFEIEYDESQRLIFGQKSYLEQELNDTFIHFKILDKAKLKEKYPEDYELRDYEAHVVANEIRNLIDNKHLIYDFSKKELRPVKYKDIIILSRTKSDQDTYHEVFKAYNIPFLPTELTGYFDSIEVLTVTSILKIIDNPLQDIPLVAVLRSPIFQIDEKELIQIKINHNDEYFYDKVLAYIKQGTNNHLIEKLKYFNEMLDYWREMIKYKSITEVLYSIYHETNYYDFVLGQSGARQRQANLDSLFERAKTYEHLITNSLFKFIQLINFFTENEHDLPLARTLSENEDLVQFMTIHKAKGLEFPIVFLTNLKRRYNIDDETREVLFDRELGISCKYLDLENRVKYQPLMQNIFKTKIHKLLLSEEMRLLYVALTRTKEKLYLIGTTDDFLKELPKLEPLSDLAPVLLPKMERDATNYLSLLLKACARHQSFTKLVGFKDNITFLSKFPDVPNCDIKVITSLEKLVDINKETEALDIDFSKYTKEFSNRLNYKYPHYDKTIHFAKLTIADMKRIQNVNEFDYQKTNLVLKKPKFIEDHSPSLRGTSFHQFMQHLDYRKSYNLESLEEVKTKLLDKAIMTREQLALVDLNKIEILFNQDLISASKNASYINKEMPFTTLISSKVVYPDMNDDIEVIVQGVVDLFIEFEDRCFLIDFKTDRLTNNITEINRIKKNYATQISVYKEAMQKIYAEKKVTSYLYLFALDKFIEM